MIKWAVWIVTSSSEVDREIGSGLRACLWSETSGGDCDIGGDGVLQLTSFLFHAQYSSILSLVIPSSEAQKEIKWNVWIFILQIVRKSVTFSELLQSDVVSRFRQWRHQEQVYPRKTTYILSSVKSSSSESELLMSVFDPNKAKTSFLITRWEIRSHLGEISQQFVRKHSDTARHQNRQNWWIRSARPHCYFINLFDNEKQQFHSHCQPADSVDLAQEKS